MGIIGSTAASSAQLKGVKKVVAGIGGSEIGMEMGIGIGDSKDLEMIGNVGLVCVDIDVVGDGGMIGGYV